MDQNINNIQPYALKADDGWVYRYGIDMVVKASEIRSGSPAAVVEYTSIHGEEPPDHIHHTEDEMFYVLEGCLTFHCGDMSVELEKGGFFYLPHGLQHGYTIPGDERVHLLVIPAPVRKAAAGGWAGFISDLERGQGELIAKPSI